MPYVQRREPGVTRDRADRAGEPATRSRATCAATRAWSCSAPQDDVILSRDEMLWLEDVFGERARIFPTGGHCGSMDQREFVREMLRLIFDAEARS